MNTYTAYNALAELDKYPAFKRELAEALEAGSHYAKWGTAPFEEQNLVKRMLKLGSMINLRSTIEQEERK